MPPEYCEYGPDFETHCLTWLKRHHPDLLETLHGAAVQIKKKERPEAPWTTEQRLTAFYQQYVPEKVEGIPALLEKYAGKEDKLFDALVKKYGPEPDDPYYADDDEEDDDEEEDLGITGSAKRRGAAAKKDTAAKIRVVIAKEAQKRKKNLTVVTGMETVPDIKLKEVSKSFSKKFAGSSSVKGNSIIVQGDHVFDAAELVVDKFNVPENCVFLKNTDGSLTPLKE